MTRDRKIYAFGTATAMALTIILVLILSQERASPISQFISSESPLPTEIANEVESFLSPLPLPSFYMPPQKSQDSQTRWIAYGGKQEGFVISIREDFVIQSGRPSNSRFSNIYIHFLIDNENMSIRGFDNPLRMPLAEFLNTPAVTISGEVDPAWLTANRDEFTKSTKTDTTEQIEVVRDDSDAQATKSLAGPSKIVTYIGHDDIVLELRLGPNSMDSEFYEPHTEVLELYRTIVSSVKFF